MARTKINNKIGINELKQRIEHIKKNNKVLDEKYFVKLQNMIKSKQKKEVVKKYYNFYFSDEIFKKINEFCEKTNISKIDGLELLIDVAFDTYDKYLEKSVEFIYVEPEEKTRYLKQKLGEETKKEPVYKNCYKLWLNSEMVQKINMFCEKTNISKTDGWEFLLNIAFDTFEKYVEKEEKIKKELE